MYENLVKGSSLWSVKATASSGSWMWRKILKYRDKAQLFHKMEIRSGRLTSFWYDIWCPLGKLIDRLGPRGFIDLGISKHASVAEAMNLNRRRRHRGELLNLIETELAKVRLVRNEEEDKSLWKKHGDIYKMFFSSHDTWEHIRESQPSCDWHKGVWFSSATPKYSFFAWLAFHDRLATGDKLLSWNVGAHVGCIFCGEAVETRDHLFFSCPYSAQVWSALASGILLHRYTTNWSSLSSLLLDTSQAKLQLFTLRYVFQISIHSLWRERNGRRHGDKHVPAITLVKLIDKNVRNRFSTIKSTGKFVDGLQYWFHTRSISL